MLQARQLGSELLVGVHSDEAILENKGPTVMRLDERCAMPDDHPTAPMLMLSESRPSRLAAGLLVPFPKPPM